MSKDLPISDLMFYVFLLFALFGLSSQQIVVENEPLSVNLHQNSDSKPLMKVTCSNTSTVNYIVRKSGQTPSYCDKCFQMLKDAAPTKGNWLWYNSGVGTLDYNVNNLYKIKIVCDDGVSTTSSVIDVNIIPNRQPVVTPFNSVCKIDAANVKAGDNALSVDPANTNIQDPDKDQLYYTLTVKPDSVAGSFSIGTDGIIRATTDLKRVCIPSVTFYITPTDKITKPPDPLTVTCSITDALTPPLISDVNKVIQIPEDVPIGQLISPLLINNPGTSPVTIEYSIIPPSAASLLSVKSNTLTVAQKLNYESRNRNFNVTLRPNNGICPPGKQYLFIRVTDKNDPPVLTPKTASYTVFERTSLASDPSVPSIHINWGPNVKDEDYVDLPGTHTYSIINGNDNNLWTIDRTTGVIRSNGIYDVDKNAMPQTASLLVQVQDSKGGIDNATIKIRIEDYNDNRPIFKQASYTYTTTDCALPQTLGSLVATDDDLGYKTGVNGGKGPSNHNNEFDFDFTTSDYVTVDQTGSVSLTKPMPAGTSVTLSVGATDKGSPLALSSLNKAIVTVTSTACPTTPAPTMAPTNSNNNGINSFPNMSATGPGQSAAANAGTTTWIILAGLLGALLLGSWPTCCRRL